MSDDRIAKPDLRDTHMKLARRYLAHPDQFPDKNPPAQLFDDTDDLAETVARHPSAQDVDGR